MKKLIYLISIAFVLSCGTKSSTDDYGFPVFNESEQTGITQRSLVEPLSITTKLANPVLSGTDYTVDVMMKSNQDSTVLFGGNFRFFIPLNLLEFVEFNNFNAGYGKFSPNPPRINTANSSSGTAYFNVSGAFTYVNGAIQITDPSQPLTYLTGTYQKVFSIKFRSKGDATCVPVILEKNADPAYGGFLRGSDGLTYVAVKELSANTTKPVVEYVEHLNWYQQEGTIKIPFGNRDLTHCPNF